MNVIQEGSRSVRFYCTKRDAKDESDRCKWNGITVYNVPGRECSITIADCESFHRVADANCTGEIRSTPTQDRR